MEKTIDNVIEELCIRILDTSQEDIKQPYLADMTRALAELVSARAELD